MRLPEPKTAARVLGRRARFERNAAPVPIIAQNIGKRKTEIKRLRCAQTEGREGADDGEKK